MADKALSGTAGRFTYLLVWAALLALSWATVKISPAAFAGSIFVPLAISSVKALLVLAFFMHLKYEGRLLKIFCLLAPAVMLIIVLLVYADVLYRQ